MEPDLDDRELLAIQAATCFALTASGRILRTNAPDQHPGPRIYMAGSAAGNIIRIGREVGEETAGAIERLAGDEPALRDPEGSAVHLERYLQLLAAEAPIQDCEPGLIWILPERLDYRHPGALVASGTEAGDRLLARLRDGGMPAALFDAGFVDVGEFWAPWCVAFDDGEIAAIAFTVGIGTASAETGVYTVEGHRGRGLAAAVTAGWAAHPDLSGRRLFYSTSRANVSSQRAAQRLGLRFLGARLVIR